MNIIRSIPTVFQQRILPFVARPVVIAVALAALALLAAAYLASYMINKWNVKFNKIETHGIAPRNPFYIATGSLERGGNAGGEGLPQGINHLIMARADLAGVGSLQQTSRAMRRLFQFEPLLKICTNLPKEINTTSAKQFC